MWLINGNDAEIPTSKMKKYFSVETNPLFLDDRFTINFSIDYGSTDGDIICDITVCSNCSCNCSSLKNGFLKNISGRVVIL